jgi:hypothetical protein
VFASDNGEGQIVAPSKAVADAWAREDRATVPSKPLTALQISFAGLQTADMWTTIAARNNGAREVNPLMDGSYTKAVAFKAAMGVSTVLATRAMAKKNKKAAIVTMVVLNGVTAAVALQNMRHARR